MMKNKKEKKSKVKKLVLENNNTNKIKSVFLISAVVSIVLVLAICYFVVNLSGKGTSAVTIGIYEQAQQSDTEYYKCNSTTYSSKVFVPHKYMDGYGTFACVKNGYEFEPIMYDATSAAIGGSVEGTCKVTTTNPGTYENMGYTCIGSDGKYVCSALIKDNSYDSVGVDCVDPATELEKYEVGYYLSVMSGHGATPDERYYLPDGKTHTVKWASDVSVLDVGDNYYYTTSRDGSGTKYFPGDKITVTSDIDLYSQDWLKGVASSCFYNESKNEYSWLDTFTALVEKSGYKRKSEYASESACETANKAASSQVKVKYVFKYFDALADGVEEEIFWEDSGTKTSIRGLSAITNFYFVLNPEYWEDNFAYWTNSNSSGGTRYYVGDEITLTEDLVLYAKYNPVTLSATFNGNGGTVEGLAFQSCVASNDDGATCVIEVPSAKKEGGATHEWSTSSSCSGTIYDDKITWTSGPAPVYYACFANDDNSGDDDSGNDNGNSGGNTATTKELTLTFDANGGTLSGNSSKTCTAADSTGCVIDGLPSASRSGYIFKGWNTTSSCNTGYYNSYRTTSSKTFYACWVKEGSDNGGSSSGNGGNSSTGGSDQPINVFFDYNDGSGRVDSTTCVPSGKYNECEIAFPTITHRHYEEYGEEYELLGWDTQDTCGQYTTSKTVYIDQNIKYYACWREVSSGNGGNSSPNGGGSSGNGGSIDNDGNVTSNSKTGEAAMIIVLLAGLLAMGYSIYYFKEVKSK